MKDLIKNRLEVKAEILGAKYVLESLPMIIKEFDVDEFNIKHMSDTAAIFTFTTQPPCDMIKTISTVDTEQGQKDPAATNITMV